MNSISAEMRCQVTLIPMYLTADVVNVVYRQWVASFPGPHPATVACRTESLGRAWK